MEQKTNEDDWDSSDSDVLQVKWRNVDILNKRKDTEQSTSRAEPMKLMFFWDLVGSERTDKVTPEYMLEVEASMEMTSPQGNIPNANDSKTIEVVLTADTPSKSPEISLVAEKMTETKSRQDDFRQAEQLEDNNLLNLSKLFDRNLLEELTTEDTWMNRLRKVIERKDRHSFELMGRYTSSLWHQMSVVDDCIIVDGRLAAP